MTKREIIKINEKKCNGCGLCIPNCPEGALQIIDGKVRLISDLFCDGLGACIGHCPEGAIKIVKREAEPYDEIKVMENVIKHGENTIRAHLEHLEDHGETEYLNQAIGFLRKKKIKIKRKERDKNDLSEADSESHSHKVSSSEEDMGEANLGGTESNGGCSCPSSQLVEFKRDKKKKSGKTVKQTSELGQWPVQLNLLTSNAPFFDNADLLVCADCVPFAYANFHSDFLKDKPLVIGCPKLDDIEHYREKLTEIFKFNKVKSVTVVIMEVPCCAGLLGAVEEAIKKSGKKIPLKQSVISIKGEKQ